MTRYLLLLDSYGLVCVGRPLWREGGSVFCIRCWPLSSQCFSGPSPLGLETMFSAALPSNGRLSVVRVRFAGMCLPSRWLEMGIRVTVWILDVYWILVQTLLAYFPYLKKKMKTACSISLLSFLYAASLPPAINFWISEPILIPVGMYIMASQPISTA
jgi:hypothetical protein